MREVPNAYVYLKNQRSRLSGLYVSLLNFIFTFLFEGCDDNIS